MPAATTILTVTALGLGLGAATWFETKQARARDEARRNRALPPHGAACASWGPVASLDGTVPVGHWEGPGDGDCWPVCPEGYEVIETDDGPRCASTTELPDIPEPEPEPEPEPVPEPVPEPEPDYPSYVGSGWTGWPHKDWFFDEPSFAEVLMNLGYLDWASTCLTPEGRFLADPCGVIVGAFQEDFNLVREYVRDAQKIFMVANALELTERIDAPTTTALLHALRIEEESGSQWSDVVRGAEIYYS